MDGSLELGGGLVGDEVPLTLRRDTPATEQLAHVPAHCGFGHAKLTGEGGHICRPLPEPSQQADPPRVCEGGDCVDESPDELRLLFPVTGATGRVARWPRRWRRGLECLVEPPCQAAAEGAGPVGRIRPALAPRARPPTGEESCAAQSSEVDAQEGERHLEVPGKSSGAALSHAAETRENAPSRRAGNNAGHSHYDLVHDTPPEQDCGPEQVRNHIPPLCCWSTSPSRRGSR